MDLAGSQTVLFAGLPSEKSRERLLFGNLQAFPLSIIYLSDMLWQSGLSRTYIKTVAEPDTARPATI